MTQTLHASPGTAVDHVFAPPVITGTSSKEALDILFHALLEVARRHEPELEVVLHGNANISEFSPELLARALQVQGIWFQLLSIAEHNSGPFAEMASPHPGREAHILESHIAMGLKPSLVTLRRRPQRRARLA